MTKFEQARNLLRVAGLGTALLTTSAGLAFAQSASFDGSNDTTGFNSENINETNVDNRSDYTLRNDSNVNNALNGSVNTGENDTNENTTAGDIESGSIDISADIENEVNSSSMSGIDMDGDGDVDVDFSNGTTGADSENTNEVNVDNRMDVDIRNNATVNNRADLNVNTGNNNVSRNTTVGNVEGGDIDASISYMNVVNKNAASMNIGSGASNSVSVSGGNTITGANSENTNEVTVSNRMNVDVRNNATMNNNFNISANTGSNTVSRNTTVDGVKTGNVSLDFSVSNHAN